MGYSSQWELLSEHTPEVCEKIVQWSQEKEMRYLNSLFSQNYLDEAKWYDHEEDMEILSKAFPDEHIIIEVQGDDPDDKWKSYTYGGECKVLRASIVWPANPWGNEE